MSRARGDTVVELMLAFAVFSLVAVSTMAIMSQGVAVAQRSMEKDLVRQQLDSQAEILRYIHTTDSSLWQSITSLVVANPMPLNPSSCPDTNSLRSGRAFYVVPKTPVGSGFALQSIASATEYSSPATYARIDYNAKKAYGLWVQVAKAENQSGNSTLDAYDFYIHGCWEGVGTAIPTTAGTIVRIYGQ